MSSRAEFVGVTLEKFAKSRLSMPNIQQSMDSLLNIDTIRYLKDEEKWVCLSSVRRMRLFFVRLGCVPKGNTKTLLTYPSHQVRKLCQLCLAELSGASRVP